MNVLLLNPPFLKNFSRPQRSPAVTKSGTLYFPMWLSYAAGLLESKGHPVDLIDAHIILRRVASEGRLAIKRALSDMLRSRSRATSLAS